MATLPTLPTFVNGESNLTNLQELSQAVSFLVDCDVRPTWHVYKTNTQSITSGSYVSPTFSAIIYDSDSVQNGTGITIVTPGYYKTEACLQLIATATGGSINCHFLVTFGSNNPHFTNGTTKVYGSRGAQTSSEVGPDAARVITAVCPYVLYPGDQVNPQIKTSATMTLDNNNNASYIKGRFVCNFTGMWIAEDASFVPPPPQDHINGFTLHTANADFTAQAGKFYIVSASGGDVTVTLPSLSASSDRAAILLKRQAGPDHIILKPHGSDKINDMPNSFVLDGLHIDQAGQGVWIYKGSTSWWAN